MIRLMKRTIIFLSLAVALLATSCHIKYEQPEVPQEALIRHYNPADSTFNVAELSWREFYKDSLLCDLIDTVLVRNLDMQVALKRLGQSAAYFKQSKWAYAPNLSASASAGYARSAEYATSEAGMDVYTGSPVFSLGVSASWEVDIWGKIMKQKKARLQQLFAQENYKNAVQTQLIANTATYYYQLVALDMQKQFTLETIDNRESYYETVQSLKASAQANEVAVLQAESQLLVAKSYIPQVETSIHHIENALNLLMGQAGVEIKRCTMTERAMFQHLKIDSTGVPALLLRNRPDVLQAENTLKANMYNYNAAVAALYPSLTLSGSVSSDAPALNQWFMMPASLIYNAIGGLLQPLINGRQLRTQRNVAYLEYEASVLDFKKTVLNAGMEVSNALCAYRNNREMVGYLYKQYLALSKAYDFSYELLLNGYATYLDVLSAQEGVFNAQMSLIDAVSQMISDQIELYRALGGGWDVPENEEQAEQIAINEALSQPMKAPTKSELRRQAKRAEKLQKAQAGEY